jgi:hypothetical protein
MPIHQILQLSVAAKSRLLVQAGANYVDEIFNGSIKEMTSKLNRSKLLINHIMTLTLNSEAAMEFMALY